MTYTLNPNLKHLQTTLALARDTDEEEESRMLEKGEKVAKMEQDRLIRLEKYRIKKKTQPNAKGFARNLKYDHDAYMKELSFNNALLKKEEEERKRLLEKKIKRGYGVSKPAMLSKGKFMLNSDARAAKH